MVKDMVVRRAKPLIALILAVLWLPVTMHCALEVLPGWEFLVCCDEQGAAPHEDNDCGADACAVVESGFYKMQDHDELIIGSTEIVFYDALSQPGEPVSAYFHPTPELSASWQFHCRAASLPRAPSSIL